VPVFVKRKDRPAPPQPLATSTAERIGAIVEAAERAAVAVIDDAEKQAQRHLDEAQTEAGRLVDDRLASLNALTDSVIAQAESIKAEAQDLVAKLEEAKRRLAAGEEPVEEPAEDAGPMRASHLSAVEPVEGSVSTDAQGESQPERGTPAGARLLATQMAVSGSSREEIEARLRNGFDIEDTAPILDAILGPEE
jgi:cell division septum initiation protein DivIVA